MHEECFKRIWHISRTSHFYSMNLQTSSHFWFLYFLLVFKEFFWRTEAHHFDDDLGSLPDQLVRDERGGEVEHGVSEGGPEHAGGGDRLGCLVTSVHQHTGHSLARRPENCITGWIRCNLSKACTNSNTSTVLCDVEYPWSRGRSLQDLFHPTIEYHWLISCCTRFSLPRI